jgi:hypothetical protein
MLLILHKGLLESRSRFAEPGLEKRIRRLSASSVPLNSDLVSYGARVTAGTSTSRLLGKLTLRTVLLASSVKEYT